MRTKYISTDEIKSKFNKKIIFSMIILFIGLSINVIPAALISREQSKTTRIRMELSDRRDNNLALRTDFAQRYSIEEIEKTAREKLLMGEPGPSQIIFINVPKQSHVVFSVEDEKDDLDNIWWQEFADIFR